MGKRVYIEKCNIPGYGTGYRVFAFIEGEEVRERAYLGYSKKDALKKFRADFNLKGKKLNIQDAPELSLKEAVRRLEKLK